MENNPICPVCKSNIWETMGSREYRKSDLSALPRYAKARYEVLFDVWTQGSDNVKFSSILCTNCGFLMHNPRATREDIDRKYIYLNNHHSSKTEATELLQSDNVRSRKLYGLTSAFTKGKVAEVLDFGGGNGRLLSSFLKYGHKCSIIDYITDTLPGIRHIGNTIDEIPEFTKFDLIICNHVLEHLAEPKETVEKLARHLAKDGVLYIEVPLEIWKTVPLPLEPVTHINFFSPASMKALLQLAGMHIIDCSECTFTSPIGEIGLAVRALSRRADYNDKNIDFLENADASKDFIKPNIYRRLRHLLRNPHYYLQEIKRWGKANIPFFWRFIKFP